jgi:hypothetical protein
MHEKLTLTQKAVGSPVNSRFRLWHAVTCAVMDIGIADMAMAL